MATLAVVLIPLAANAVQPALGGNCPVCLVETAKVVPGSDKHAVTFDRQMYYFPSDKEKGMFAANPAKYAPALGGDCAVCRVNMGVRVPGKAEFAVVHDKRAYLFSSAKERDAFMADPKKYEGADIAEGGYCSVCAVMAKKWVAGKPKIVSVYDGMRYYFPGADEKKAFDADPAKFTPSLDGDCVVCLKHAGKRVAGLPKFSAMHDGRIFLFPDEGAQKKFLADTASFVGKDMKIGAAPAVKPEAVVVTGKTACAGCAYGVRPMTIRIAWGSPWLRVTKCS